MTKQKRARSDARGQHYVPQFLLESFATPGKKKGKFGQLHAFDKTDGHTFRPTTDGIFAQRDFNTHEADGKVLCLEEGMGSVEDLAAPVLKKIIATASVTGVSVRERAALHVFVALQKIRGVSLRAQMGDSIQSLKAKLREGGDDPEMIPQLQGDDGPEGLKLSALNITRRYLAEFAHTFENKTLVLLEAPAEGTFLIGDCPVVWANNNDTGPYGNLGLEVVGIEIYMPIAPRLALGFWCPSLIAILAEALDHVEATAAKLAPVALLGVGPAALAARRDLDEARTRAERIRGDLAQIAAGLPLMNSAENMEYVNALQSAQAERFLVSHDGDFSFARRMIADDSRFRRGARFEIA